jgi:hypothetical protein
LKDVVANAKEHRGQYEVKISEAIVEKRNPRFKDGEIFNPVGKEILVDTEVKTHEIHRTAHWYWRKMGQQIQGFFKPNTIKQSRLRHVEVPSGDGTTWTKVEDKEEVINHLIEINVEQISNTAAIPFGYTQLGNELVHTGDSDMAESILNDTLEHEYMEDEAIRAIVEQLKRHPAIWGILTQIVTAK